MAKTTHPEQSKSEAARDRPKTLSLVDAYRDMLTIRLFEEEIQRQFLRGNIHGTTHLYIGQEAIAVGVASALDSSDLVAATYRNHGHAIARGVDPSALAAEMMGRASGICGGRAGSMNILDPSHGLLGGFCIVGGSLGAAVGAGLALRGTGRAAVAFFGDGATNQGYFGECINFAAVLNLPVLFVCENNGYGEYTAWDRVTAGRDIPGRVRAYGVSAKSVDGNDVAGVFDAAVDSLQHVKRGGGPQFIEAVTYRLCGHNRSDPATYRPEGELAAWLEKDPLKRTRGKLLEDSLMTQQDLDTADEGIKNRVNSSFQAALAAPYPSPDVSLGEYCND